MNNTQFKEALTAEEIYKRFADKFKAIANEVMGDVVSEFLPHSEGDLDSNIYHRSMDYITGEYGDNTIYGSMGKRFRQRIFEENKESLINQINQDNLDRIAELEKDVASWKESYYRK